jgi:hypothetical protein
MLTKPFRNPDFSEPIQNIKPSKGSSEKNFKNINELIKVRTLSNRSVKKINVEHSHPYQVSSK